jgi:TonB family protein
MDFATQWQGQVVDGRFPLEQYLGGSEQQAVFLTRIPGGATKAAIKLIRATACNPDAQLAAWRRAAKLSHPHLIRIYDGGRCWLAGTDLVFVVTEYAEENLGQVVPQRALTAAEADAMAGPTIEALTYLHDQSLVHGHLRPSNVMAVNDQLKLSTDSVQEPGSSVRKPQPSVYDVPEGASVGLSAASDVWSLGATLAESLTQRVPRKNAENVKLPQPFADIVTHSLREDPASRWKVRDISARLKTATDKHPESSVASSAAVSSVSAAEGSRSRPFLFLLIGAIVVIAAGLFFFAHRGSDSGQQAATSSPAATAPAKSPATQSSPSLNSPGSALNRVLPAPSRGALNTIHGRIKVRVRVAVDATGNVTRTNFVTAGPSQYFARLAAQAAQKWKFAPAIANGQPASTEWTILFEYTRSGVEASQQPAHSR